MTYRVEFRPCLIYCIPKLNFQFIDLEFWFHWTPYGRAIAKVLIQNFPYIAFEKIRNHWSTYKVLFSWPSIALQLHLFLLPSFLWYNWPTQNICFFLLEKLSCHLLNKCSYPLVSSSNVIYWLPCKLLLPSPNSHSVSYHCLFASLCEYILSVSPL